MIKVELPYAEYAKMVKIVNDFKKEKGRFPNYVDFNGVRFTESQYGDAFKRVSIFRDENGRYPNYVTLEGTPIIIKSALHLQIESAVGGAYNTATGLYNLIKANEDYAYYYNDVYPQGAAIQRLKDGQGLNCSDFSQIGFAALVDLEGYEVRYKHVKCLTSGLGHVFLQARGKELGDSWVNYDLAAAAKSSYSLGNAWCSNGTLVAYNPAWLMSDDGKV
jgi:hypothetical protein